MKTKEFYGHEVQTPELVDQVHTYVRERPGIDAPDICKGIVIECYHTFKSLAYKTDAQNLQSLSGSELANYLGDQWGGTWSGVCEAVDYLLAEGRITFSDDGELNCVE